MIKIMTLLLMGLTAFGADNYMFFSINSMEMNFNSSSERLEGRTSASEIYVMMMNNEFEITTRDGEEFVAQTYLESDRFTFFKDGMKFSTALGGDNPILSLTKIQVKNAKVEIASSGISVMGESLSTHLYGIGFDVTNVDMSCPTDKFTTDIDKACVQETKIRSLEPNGVSHLVLYDTTGARDYRIDIKARKVDIKGSQLNIESEHISGFFRETSFAIENGDVSCFKNPKLNQLNVEQFITGCLQVSKVSASGINFVSSGINTSINNVELDFGTNYFHIEADKAAFKSLEKTAYIKNMRLICEKDVIDSKSYSNSPILNGCLRSSQISFGKLEAGVNISNGKLEIADTKFLLRGKLKFLFKIKVLAKGSIVHNSLTNQLIIKVKKATIAGISARSLAISIIKRFIDSTKVIVTKHTITIQL